MRMLSSALGRHAGLGTFQDLQQCLLHTFTGDVAGDGDVLGFFRDLVDLVDVDDAVLRALDVIVRGLDQLQEDVLHVLADIARFRQRCGVRDGEGNVQKPRQRLGEIGLSGSGGAQQHDVGLLDLHVPVPLRGDALVMVVDRDGERFLRRVLSDHVFVKEFLDLLRFQEIDPGQFLLSLLSELLIQDIGAKIHALVADIDIARSRKKLPHLVLRLSAEGAADSVVSFGHFPSCQ